MALAVAVPSFHCQIQSPEESRETCSSPGTEGHSSRRKPYLDENVALDEGFQGSSLGRSGCQMLQSSPWGHLEN